MSLNFEESYSASFEISLFIILNFRLSAGNEYHINKGLFPTPYQLRFDQVKIIFMLYAVIWVS